MHLYIGVQLQRLATNRWQATAPDLPACRAEGHSAGEALARARLALEGLLAERLAREETLPEPTGLDALRAAGGSGDEFFLVHINLRHLQALANHQARRNPGGG